MDVSSVLLVFFTICVFFLPVLALLPPIPPSLGEALQSTHIKVGIERPRRLRKRIQTVTSGTSGAVSSGPAKISSLWIYPVKSCKGIEVARSKVLPAGLEFDRLFTFAQLRSPFPVGLVASEEEKSQHKWEFITQRQFPLLATVQVDLYVPDATKASSFSSTAERLGDPYVILRFPWRDAGWRGSLSWVASKIRHGIHGQPEKEILLPVTFPSAEEIKQQGYTFEPVRIWKDTVRALNMEKELPPELRLYLGVSNRLGLFRVDPGALREVYRCAPSAADAGYQPVTGFQDAYPLHMLNLASVRDLDSKIAKDKKIPSLDPRRFRPNIIIDGPSAYDEDTWKKVRFRDSSGKGQDMTMHVSCRTVRCKMPNVDQDDGFRHPVEPDKSLRKYREVDEGAPHLGCLGMQLTPLFEDTKTGHGMEGWLEAGMAVEVVERGTHRYIRQ
ncbi:hypothetical protein VTK73DRAFT_7089 [Phialemonium thermophilum]|uniref:MOSC domain-containing protein n=1 Tax=Phialemonium thermophilum TaxID=223376 RepID=A0ABR3XUV8_9PEZI